MSDIRLPVGGAIVLTDACPATHREPIRELLDSYGMPAKIMPKPATPLDALGPAMTENYPPPGNKVRHVLFPYQNSSPGKKIGRHDPAEHLRVEEKFCETVAIATLRMKYLELEEGQRKPKQEWTGDIRLEPYDPDKERAILAYMRHAKDIIPSGKLHKLVTDIVENLGGQRLITQTERGKADDDDDGEGKGKLATRSQSAMWITADMIPLFKQIKTQIEAASAKTDHRGRELPPTQIHVLSIMADEEMARAVISMLMGEVDREVARVEARFSDETMTPDKIGNEISKALGVQDKLARYEGMLNRPLENLKAKTSKLVVEIASKSLEKASMTL